MTEDRTDWVGPVVDSSPGGRAVVSAILALNPRAQVQDRGAYLRVLVPGHCLLTRRAVEQELGRPFRLPADLEPLMPAFKGLIHVSEEQIEWSFEVT